MLVYHRDPVGPTRPVSTEKASKESIRILPKWVFVSRQNQINSAKKSTCVQDLYWKFSRVIINASRVDELCPWHLEGETSRRQRIRGCEKHGVGDSECCWAPRKLCSFDAFFKDIQRLFPYGPIASTLSDVSLDCSTRT